MHNSDILDKVQRSLLPHVYVSTGTLEGIIRDYGSVDLDTVEPPEDSGA